jgi:5'(3')-deoxyribonucleotidase
MPKVLVDLDGVVFDFDRTWRTRWNIQYPELAVAREAPQTWDVLHELTRMPTPAAFWDWFEHSGGYAKMSVHQDAIEAVRLLWVAGWEVVYATNRPNTVQNIKDTANDLTAYGLGEIGYLLFTDDKSKIPNVDLAFEDAPPNLAAMQGKGIPVFRVAQLWNRIPDYPALRDIPAVASLSVHNLLPILEQHKKTGGVYGV